MSAWPQEAPKEECVILGSFTLYLPLDVQKAISAQSALMSWRGKEDHRVQMQTDARHVVKRSPVVLLRGNSAVRVGNQPEKSCV